MNTTLQTCWLEMGIAMTRPTILIAALMVVTVVDHVLTMNTVQTVNATLEILVSATAGLLAKTNFFWTL